jgi:dephospho-CoA kinase
MFRALGAEVIDADALAREVVEKGQPALEAISARFPGVVGADGTLDRKKLADLIFADGAERAALNQIVHPYIREAFWQRVQRLSSQGATTALYDAPLLIEAALHAEMDGVVLVTAPPDVQKARLRARSGLTAEEAELRIASQLPLSEKVRHATWVVDNSGDLPSTRAQVERIWAEILQLPRA